MNQKAKIAIAIGTTLVLGVGGYLIYRSVTKKNEAARKYLNEVDENGGQVPINLNRQKLKNLIAVKAPIKAKAAALNL